MTAKEKSKELIQKYFDLFSNLGYYASLSEGKKCALIAVEELIKEQTMWQNGDPNPVLFWQEVEKEIKEL
jgi:hypothetical protein